MGAACIEQEKNCHFKLTSALLFAKGTTRFSIGYEKWILYDNLRRYAQILYEQAPWQFPKTEVHQKKKVMITVWWFASDLIHKVFGIDTSILTNSHVRNA